VKLTLAVFEPLVKVLHLVDGDARPSMGFVYGELLKAKKQIKDAFGTIKARFMDVIAIVDKKMNGRLDSPLHLTKWISKLATSLYHGWLYLLSWNNHVLKMNLRPGGMMIVQQQGMEVLGVNLSPSASFKDRYAVRPCVMLNACLTLSWSDKSFRP